MYHAFNEITPVPNMLVTREEINVVSWRTLIVVARRSCLYTGWNVINTLTPIVAATVTGMEYHSWNVVGKRGGQRTYCQDEHRSRRRQ